MKRTDFIALLLLLASSLAAASDLTPYSAASKTYQIAVSNVSSTPVQVVPNNPNFSGCVQYMFSNTGSVDAWVVLGTASAGTTAVAATTVTPSTSFLVQAGSSVVRTAFQNAYVAAITAASTTTLNVSCGSGAIYSAGTSALSGGTVTSDQGAPAATADSWPVKVTDGTDTALVTAAGEQNVIATAQPGVDIGDVTVNNAAGATSVPAQGATASDSPVSGNPIRIGAQARSSSITAVTSGDAVDLVASTTGVLATALDSAAADNSSNTIAALVDRNGTALRNLGVSINCFDGSTWDRCRTADIGNAVAGTGVLAASPYGNYLTNANQVALTTGQYTALMTDPAGNLRTAPQRPTATDILVGYATVTATTATTTLITVSAGRTWVGQLCASVDGNKAAAATGNGLVNATFLTTGTNVVPAAGTYFGVGTSIGANAATGVTGTQSSNQGCTPFTTVAPAGNTTTINYVTTCTNTTACNVHVSAIGVMQ